MIETNRIPSDTRWWDIPAILLLVVILTTAFSRLTATSWTDDLIVTRVITYTGLIAGLALGYSRFRSRSVVFFATVYGVFFIVFRIGLLLGAGIPWQERLLSLAGRLGVIIQHLVEQKAVPDNLLFIVLMGIVFWTISVNAGYNLMRSGNPWAVILPSGIALVLIHSYDSYLTSRNWYLVIYLFFALLLLARLVFIQKRKLWETRNTYLPPYLGLDFVRITLVISIVLLLFSWTAPALADTLPAAEGAWQRIKQPWNDVRNMFDNAFASLRSTVGIVTDYYGPNLVLGRGNRLTDSIVFLVRTPPDPPDGVRFYWRARAYDLYDGGWSSTMNTTQALEPNDFDISFPDLGDNDLQEYTFGFTVGNPIATLFIPNQAIWISRPVRAEFARNPDGSADLSSVRATPPLRSGENYTVRASFNQVTVSSLRNAGTDYPEWVRERYLKLPDSITQRTIDLANFLAEGKDNPYDIATAITNYLRTNIEYSETVPLLPSNQDLVDWFLFDLQQGFCNYYASAEIVMLRALGIPARMAAGYAQGNPTDEPDVYVVRQRESHAWPEVYFPGVGWVEFEPTVSQPPLLRPLGDRPERNTAEIGANQFEDDQQANTDLPENLRGLEEGAGNIAPGITSTSYIILAAVGILALAFIILLIPILRRRKIQNLLPRIPAALESGFRKFGLQPPVLLRKWAHRAALTPISRSYLEISLALSRLGRHPQPFLTPTERASALVAELPPMEVAAQTILSEYHLATYSTHNHPDLTAAQKAGQLIRFASIKEYLLRFLDRIRPRGDAFQ